MKKGSLSLGVGMVLMAVAAPTLAVAQCAPDAVEVGPTCVDKYEASVWSIPAASIALINRVRKGKATLTDLLAGGATQYTDNIPPTFPENGNWTAPVYAASLPGVLPTTIVTWFQAEQACALSGKRLLTNQEWQRAAAGTPDNPLGADNGTTDCNVDSVGDLVNAGSRSACVSLWGAFDMVGNVSEWVADWMPEGAACSGWGAFSDDYCLPDTSPAVGMNALVRGGFHSQGAFAGVFSVGSFLPVWEVEDYLGFRCGR